MHGTEAKITRKMVYMSNMLIKSKHFHKTVKLIFTRKGAG